MALPHANTPLFNPACPCCQDDLGMHTIIPAAPGTRNPLSDPKESVRKELTQCQHCWKRKTSDVTLFKCTGCKVEVYCSKECQKLAWPTHKVKCKIQQKSISDAPPGAADCLAILRKFTSKHRPTLCEAGVQALQLYDPAKRSSTMDRLLIVFLHARPAQRTEFAFYMTGADVVPFEMFGDAKAAEMRDQLKRADKARARGTMGTFFVMLMCVNSTAAATNIMNVTYSKDVLLLKPMAWKEWMQQRLNEGIVA